MLHVTQESRLYIRAHCPLVLNPCNLLRCSALQYELHSESPSTIYYNEVNTFNESAVALLAEEAKQSSTCVSSVLDVTTVEDLTIMPKNASCPLSLKSAISARAPPTWWPTAQSKHSSPPRALREP